MSGYQRRSDGLLTGVDNTNGMLNSPLDSRGVHPQYQEMRMGQQRFRNPMSSGLGSTHQYEDPFTQTMTNSPPLTHRSTTSSLGPPSSRRSSVSLEIDAGDRMETVLRELDALRRNYQGRIDEMEENNNKLAAKLAEVQEAVKRLEEKVSANAETSKSSKSVANQHKQLKVSELYEKI
jgi:hypothetical protein